MNEPKSWYHSPRAFQTYIAHRRKYTASAPRRTLADFLIRAHALRSGFTLLTLDSGLYKSAFPRLTLINV